MQREQYNYNVLLHIDQEQAGIHVYYKMLFPPSPLSLSIFLRSLGDLTSPLNSGCTLCTALNCIYVFVDLYFKSDTGSSCTLYIGIHSEYYIACENV